jgi:two-component sensor histidine kinase
MAHDQCPMAVALREDRPVRGVEAIAERPDGTRVPFIPYPTPLHDASGALIGAVNMLVDISHRKDAETQQRLLFSELNHRIKNNMQMLHGLLNAARREARSAVARAALADTVQRIGAMAAAQKVLYQAGEADRYDAGEFIASVCESASQAFGAGVRLNCDSKAGDIANDTATPLALIVNELTTNAAKHALDAGGEARIDVSLTREGDLVTLEVADDGPGFVLGPLRRRTSGLGLVAGLARQLDGELRVERDGGARCIVRFHDARGG